MPARACAIRRKQIKPDKMPRILPMTTPFTAATQPNVTNLIYDPQTHSNPYFLHINENPALELEWITDAKAMRRRNNLGGGSQGDFKRSKRSVEGLSHPSLQVGENALVYQPTGPGYDPRAPNRANFDEDYFQYMMNYPAREEEELDLSSINENEPLYQLEGPGYCPRAPSSRATDSDTREWYRLHEDLALSAQEVPPPGTPESVGPSLQSTANTKKIKTKGKGVTPRHFRKTKVRKIFP
nr:uncharacterized protein LOC109176758 [Ipomoea batatas]